jgi:GntR family transcriptional regulator, transcriptional repressor for pyruvate dehydrogenase complex
MNVMVVKTSYISPIKKSPVIPTLVAEQIIDLISRGKLKLGDKLPSEFEMTQRFHISRISLREAMKLLEAKGYIESRHRLGKFVISKTDPAKTSIEDLLSLDQKKIWELLCVRRILDSEAASLACTYATPKDIARMKSIYRRTMEIGEEKILQEGEEGGKLYTEFFNALLDCTKNSVFVYIRKSMNSVLIGALPYSRKKLSTVDGSSRAIIKQIQSLIDAIEKRDKPAARSAVEEHIDYLKRSLKKSMQSS